MDGHLAQLIEKKAADLTMDVGYKKLHPMAVKPKRGTELASGFDLHALDVIKPKQVGKVDYMDVFPGKWVWPFQRVLVRTGVAVQMDKNMEALIRPRSGLSLKRGVYVAYGTIDADYTGDLGIILTNLSFRPFYIKRGDRVAQLVFAPVHHDVNLHPVSEFEETDRGDGAYGHTGVSK